MPITPSSDIVLDVVRAADPARAAEATQRLRVDAANASGDFEAALSSAAAPGTAEVPAPIATKAGARDTSASKAAVQLETVLLNNFVSAMLPQSATAYFGQGLAGDMWKSMLADRVAHQIAQSGVTGIASRLLSGRIAEAVAKSPHGAGSSPVTAPAATQTSAEALSISLAVPNGIEAAMARHRI